MRRAVSSSSVASSASSASPATSAASNSGRVPGVMRKGPSAASDAPAVAVGSAAARHDHRHGRRPAGRRRCPRPASARRPSLNGAVPGRAFSSTARARGVARLRVRRQRVALLQHQVDARADDAVGALQRPLDLAGQRVDVAGALLGRRRDQARLAVGLGEAAAPIVRQPERAQQVDGARPVRVRDPDGVRRAAARRRALVGQLLGADAGALERRRRLVRRPLVDAVQDVRGAGAGRRRRRDHQRQAARSPASCAGHNTGQRIGIPIARMHRPLDLRHAGRSAGARPSAPGRCRTFFTVVICSHFEHAIARDAPFATRQAHVGRRVAHGRRAGNDDDVVRALVPGIERHHEHRAVACPAGPVDDDRAFARQLRRRAASALGSWLVDRQLPEATATRTRPTRHRRPSPPASARRSTPPSLLRAAAARPAATPRAAIAP